MNRTNHTPGPWRSEFEHMGGYDCLSDCFRIVHRQGDTLAVLDLKDYSVGLYGRGLAIESERAEATAIAQANARLIAAAPDLLAALETALMSGLDAENRAAARAAIAKAHGEAV